MHCRGGGRKRARQGPANVGIMGLQEQPAAQGADHAGTRTMDRRRDSLPGAAGGRGGALRELEAGMPAWSILGKEWRKWWCPSFPMPRQQTGLGQGHYRKRTGLQTATEQLKDYRAIPETWKEQELAEQVDGWEQTQEGVCHAFCRAPQGSIRYDYAERNCGKSTSITHDLAPAASENYVISSILVFCPVLTASSPKPGSICPFCRHGFW